MTSSRILHEWQAWGGRYQLCVAGGPRPGWTELPRMDARWAFGECAGDWPARVALRQAMLGGTETLPANLDEPGVVDRELEERRLVVLHQAIAPLATNGGPYTPAPKVERAEPEPRRDRAWVDITVVDDSPAARPLSGVSFVLDLPDGSRRTGVLDGRGRLRIEEITPGKCSLQLTELRVALEG